MKPMILVFFIVATILPFSLQAKENCDRALDSIPKFESSKKMFVEISQFKDKYAHCMDGGIAEGIATVIVESLDKNWLQVDEIESLSSKDSSFKKFILTNIEPNVTGQETEVKSVVTKAKNSCPKKMKSFCKELIQSCERSLKPE